MGANGVCVGDRILVCSYVRSMYKRANHAMKSLESLSAYLGRLALVASVYATLDLSMNFGVNKFSVRIYCLKLKFDA